MLSRKKRDAKFLIFQSLYIIAIAILFYKGTDLSLTKVIPYIAGDTIVRIADLPKELDTSKTIVSKTVLDSLKKNKYVPKTDTIVSSAYLNELIAGQKKSIPTSINPKHKDSGIDEPTEPPLIPDQE